MDRIYSILASGCRDPVTSVMVTLKVLNVKNSIKKDVQNMQTLFLKNEDGKEMCSLINHLENRGYIVRLQVNSQHEVKDLFFISKSAVEKTRLRPETLTIDATYKTNAHKMSLVNIAGISNVTSEKNSSRLQTFVVAVAFVNSKTKEIYTWILEKLQEAVWPEETNFKLPSVIVTGNEQTLRNAIEFVLPETQHLLCSWHLWNIMTTKLPIGDVSLDEYDYRRAAAKAAFYSVIPSYNLESYRKAISGFEQQISTPGYFKENGVITLNYLKELSKDSGLKRWVGMYANQH